MRRIRVLGAVAVSVALLGGALVLEWVVTANDKPRIPELDSRPAVVGDLATLVHGFVSRIPGRGSGGYDRPAADEEAAMAAAFRAIEEGHVDEASSLVESFDYSVVHYTDIATDRSLTILAERQNPDGSWAHAWGLYIHSDRSPSKMTVEVAHPLADVDTELVGVDIFRAANSANLFVCGAERDARADGSADVAHSQQSVFEAIHEMVLSPEATIVQPHGFEGTGTHGSYGNIIVSPDLLRRMAQSLVSAGLHVCLYDGVNCRGLGGTTNVQGRSTRQTGGLFVHLEMDPGIRASRAQSALVARVVAAVLG